MTEAPIWPDRLRIRDTGLHDDLGGPGQRIYTTAGRGYERQEYVRADLFDALTAERDALRSDCAILLANIDTIEDATGEGPEGEDRVIVEQIRTSLNTSKPRDKTAV